MDNAPKIAISIVLALAIGAVFLPTAKDYSTDVSNKVNQQTTALFDNTLVPGN